MLAVTFLLCKTLQSASSPSTVRALRAGTVLEENRKQCCKCIPCAQHCVSIQPMGLMYAQAAHWGIRWHPTNSVKAKSPTALSPLVRVCVCGGTHVTLRPSQIGLGFQKVPYDLKNIISYLPLLPTFYLFIKLDILFCFFLFQVWPSLVCC